MPSRFFPPVERAAPEGLVAIGGPLSTERLLDAYAHGVFPWPSRAEDPMLWWSPDPRAILPLDEFYISRRLGRTIRSCKFEIRMDTAFRDVIAGCSIGAGREGGTWLTPEMIAAYTRLHDEGHAHSVEAWYLGELVGGVYGVAIGGLFAAESMFYRVRDASKVALAALVDHLGRRGYELLDVQQWTPHTGSLGVVEISRAEYLQWLARATALLVSFG